ncbi:uncharacterized protein LOC115881776 [Sitophilus oryzae]|uniref:Regulatory protein zeste n=1 Tax=Sitophilus oryzae TaxID=7048 RepID=A0A6J2XWZ9_SITOR|nr:uncharacterized protein LOC115881776 [Sitophilus oryzae]
MEEEQFTQKRKRSQNITNNEQYEWYVEAMENDYIFRSGSINPTIDPNYINNKWYELVLKINCVGKGPSLTRQMWQKRFKDWKNATRVKYRKLLDNRSTTGGGVGDKIAFKKHLSKHKIHLDPFYHILNQ